MKTPLIFTALTLCLCLTGCKPTPSAGSSTTRVETTPATTAQAARKDLVGFAFFDGKVFSPPGISSDVIAPYELPIDKVYVQVGNHVSKGAPIVKLTMPGVKESLTMAEGNRASTRAAYNAALSTQSERVKSAEASLKEARAQEAAARAEVAGGGTTDYSALTQARVDAERELATARAERDANTISERQNLASAEEYLADVKAGSNQGMVRAPLSGTVVRLDAKPGLTTTARQVLALVTNLDKVQIQGTVPPDMAKEVQKGSKILIAMEGANSDPFEGEVTDISVLPPSAGQKSSGYLAVIGFNNSKGVVQPGMKIKRLGLRTGKVDNAIVVPVGAVAKSDKGITVVFVKNGSDWVETTVETGISDGALIQIKSGIKEGDTVRVQAQTVAP